MTTNIENTFKQDVIDIYENGYGIIAKKVMTDSNISIEAKAIYAYLVSFAGNEDIAFPSKKTILSDLAISENRYYKHRQQLVDAGYIKTQIIETENHFKKTTFHIIKKLYSNFTSTKKDIIQKSKNFVETKKCDKVFYNQNPNLQNKDEGALQNKGHNNNNTKLSNYLDTIDTKEKYTKKSANFVDSIWQAQKNKLPFDETTISLIENYSYTDDGIDIEKAQNIINHIFKAKKIAEKELLHENKLTQDILAKKDKNYYDLNYEQVDFASSLKTILYNLQTKKDIKNRMGYFFVAVKNILKNAIEFDMFCNISTKSDKIIVPITY